MLFFEWDQHKAESNLDKHGVSFEEAATAFGDALSLTIPDPEHSSGEYRFILLGLSSNDRHLVVAHTMIKFVLSVPDLQPSMKSRPIKKTGDKHERRIRLFKWCTQ